MLIVHTEITDSLVHLIVRDRVRNIKDIKELFNSFVISNLLKTFVLFSKLINLSSQRGLCLDHPCGLWTDCALGIGNRIFILVMAT